MTVSDYPSEHIHDLHTALHLKGIPHNCSAYDRLAQRKQEQELADEIRAGYVGIRFPVHVARSTTVC